MSGIKDQDRIEALRKRLYERGKPMEQHQNHILTDKKEEVKTQWAAPPEPIIPEVVPEPEAVEGHIIHTPTELDMSPKKKKKGYRLKLLLAGIIFFVLAVGGSSAFLMFGNNSISGENIAISVSGPFTIGGGETLPLQVGITNSNVVAIESATLIVEYPLGTHSALDVQKELFAERLALDTVAAGETINIPLRAVVFGEENDDQTVNVSIEYRVQGSNALFFKEADPLRYKISSSPIIVKTASLKKVSSGQETDIELTITSNSQSTLSEVLVKAEYPNGFDFTSSNPSPVSAQNVWIIADLEPEEEQTITITGIVVGRESDEYAINFTVGVPSERDPQSLASVFATTQTEFEIEQPFLDIELEIAGVTNGSVVVEPDQQVGASIEITNTLDDTLYDIIVEVELDGNALSDLDVGPPNGFYDSLNNKIVWDVSSSPDLAELRPGETTRLAFGVVPSGEALRTPQINFNVNVDARRVSESNVSEKLTGTASSILKVASAPDLKTTVGFNSGSFTDVGPLPPKAEESTNYSVSFMIENGSNALSDTVVTAVLPSYVTWKDQTSGAGAISYNPSDRSIAWTVGAVEGNAAVFAAFQVTLLPSKIQVGTAPVLVKEQRLKANDLFTGTVVRDVMSAVTSEMSIETGYEKENGRVVE
ncbi:MAG: hypothetical protein ACI9H6_000596 [Patiriisocius sp.]|jgi:hypothetical protein